MWQAILNALVDELAKNPDRVFGILEQILGIVKNNPEAQKAIIDIARARMIPSTPPATTH